MRLPFTTAQFFDVFSRYNEAVWPMQVLLLATALLAAALAFRTARRAARVVTGILGGLWLWMGAIYHIGFFREINPAGTLFGAMFILQAALFIRRAWRAPLTFDVRRDKRGISGAAMIAYALVLYPLLGFAGGRAYPATPTFGLPCPTTIFTLGLLLWVRRPLPTPLLVIPSLWAIVGTVAALQLGVPEDFGLLVSGVLVVSALLTQRWQPGTA